MMKWLASGLARDTASVVVVSAALCLALSPEDPALGGLAPHPAWIAILALAARYGVKGLVVSVVGSFVLVAAAVAVSSGHPFALANRVADYPDLVALLAAFVVATVGELSERHGALLHAGEQAARRELAQAEKDAAVLRQTVSALRGETARLGTALPFLRDATRRLDHADVRGAVDAALELAIARTGARLAAVHLADEETAGTYAQAGPWSGTAEASDRRPDRTAATALTELRLARVLDLAEAGPGDSDVAAPIVDPAGAVLGVLTLRGLPFAFLQTSSLPEVAFLAEWIAEPLGRRQVTEPDA